VAAEDAISAALPFKTLITGFWLPPKAFSVGKTSRYSFHNLLLQLNRCFLQLSTPKLQLNRYHELHFKKSQTQ